MRLTDASVAIRPRNNWEALDLGILMARQHLPLLMASWALITLPLLALLTLLLWDYPGWCMVIFWWLKPAYERLPLYILSRSLFRAAPSLKQAIKAYPALLKPQIIASLTWRRLHPLRSFNLPIQQLEGLERAAYRQRATLLSRSANGAATWLTLGGVMIEIVLYGALLGLIYLFIPGQLIEQISWYKLLGDNALETHWLDHLSNGLYALALVLWGPIYVACGFSLYLNRRSSLEAWDIELVFRRLRQRLLGSAYAMLLGLAFVFSLHSQPLWANDAEHFFDQEHYDQSYLDEAKELFAEPRLTQQPLNADQARQSIRAIIIEPPFHHSQLESGWRLAKSDNEKQNSDFPDFSDLEISKTLSVVSYGLKILLWGLLIGGLILLIWRYREWIRAFASRIGISRTQLRKPPTTLFGLDIAPDSLPHDVASEAERLWQDNPRLALSLLYRALLSRLIHHYQLDIRSAHTEGEVLTLISPLQLDDLMHYSTQLSHYWQEMAYGHHLPPAEACAELCQGWRRLLADNPL